MGALKKYLQFASYLQAEKSTEKIIIYMYLKT